LLRQYDNDPQEAKVLGLRAQALTAESNRVLRFSIDAQLAGAYIGVGEAGVAEEISRRMFDEAASYQNALMMAAALSNHANAIRETDVYGAISKLEEALALVGDGFPAVAKWLHVDMGQLCVHTADLRSALSHFLNALELGVQLNDRLVVCAAIEGVAAACIAQGDCVTASRLLNATQPTRATFGLGGRSWDATSRRAALSAVAAAGPPAATPAQTSLRLHEAITTALAMENRLVVSSPGVPMPSAPPHTSQAIDSLDRLLAEALAPSEVRFQRLDTGNTVFGSSLERDTCVLVVDGSLKVWSSSQSAREVIFGIAGPGDPLNLVCLHDAYEWPWNATALVDAKLMRVRMTIVRDLLLRDQRLMAAWHRSAEHQIHELCKRVFEFGVLDANGRVAAALLDLTESESPQRVERSAIELPFGRFELAATCGISREALTKAFRQLRDAHVIEVSGRSVQILDRNRLESLAERAPSRPASRSR
jgi:CRP/FNR family transcriptional regulator